MQTLGFAADHAAPQQSLRRRGDDAGDRNAVRHDGDVDGEFVAAGEKFLGAVERIDDQETWTELPGGLRPTLSSAITGMPGSRRETPSTMTASDASSAAVTGERSFLICRATDENGVAKGRRSRPRDDTGEPLERSSRRCRG